MKGFRTLKLPRNERLHPQVIRGIAGFSGALLGQEGS